MDRKSLLKKIHEYNALAQSAHEWLTLSDDWKAQGSSQAEWAFSQFEDRHGKANDVLDAILASK